MTFEFPTRDGDTIRVRLAHRLDGPAMAVEINDGAPAYLPLDRVEELVAGIRDVARQAGAAAFRPVDPEYAP